jgi:putative heme-binding domain-containing protein
VLTALADGTDSALGPATLELIVKKDPELGLRELAAKTLPFDAVRAFSDAKYPANIRVQALPGLKWSKVNDYKDLDVLYDLAGDADPFLRHEAIRQYARQIPIMYWEGQLPPGPGAGALPYVLAAPHSYYGIPNSKLRWLITSTDEDVRFLTVKWIADKKLKDMRPDVEKLMAGPKISVRMYMACATALARLDGQEVNEKSLADYFANRLADDATPAALRIQLLKQVPATHPKLTVELLTKLLNADDDALKLEAVRALIEHPSPKKSGLLLDVFRNPKLPISLRAFATLALGAEAEKELAAVAQDEKSPLRMDALRTLNGDKARPIEKDRPPAKDIDAWMKRLEGPADAGAGARIFFHPKLGGCYKCHRIDGRGQDVGPDLSSIGRNDRRNILESILQPSNTIAPHYVSWVIEMKNGKVLTGMLIHTHLDEYTFLDANGGRFKVKTGDIAEQRAATVSIMPEGLVDRMTDQEMRDLLAYLQARK